MSWKVGWGEELLHGDVAIASVCHRRLDPHSLVQLQEFDRIDLGSYWIIIDYIVQFCHCLSVMKCYEHFDTVYFNQKLCFHHD